MRRALASLAVVALVAVLGTVALVWRLAGDDTPRYPRISAYSAGQMVRVGPYQYCSVLDLTDCADTGEQGVLHVDERDVVQLSVPAEIARAPWRLLRVYEDPRDSTLEVHRPGTRLAVTIPTVDPHRGRLVGIAVQLMTLVQDPEGMVFDLPHAEWSVRTVWD